MLPFGRRSRCCSTFIEQKAEKTASTVSVHFIWMCLHYAINKCKWRLDKCHTNEIHFSWREKSGEAKRRSGNANVKLWHLHLYIYRSRLICIRCFPISKCQTDKETCCLGKETKREKKPKHTPCWKVSCQICTNQTLYLWCDDFCAYPVNEISCISLLVYSSHKPPLVLLLPSLPFFIKNEGDSTRTNIEGVNEWVNACGVYLWLTIDLSAQLTWDKLSGFTVVKRGSVVDIKRTQIRTLCTAIMAIISFRMVTSFV